ncbi:hypothetical protein [uncultured Microbulbifer sp.]|uniref:hypothetical protein n=1 Tax=uncultured Microbulbifer sp. TaxID=348147 RepID=UPI0025FD228A|nr:hypothetical protein [uncultured Microbulbifer sp.]
MIVTIFGCLIFVVSILQIRFPNLAVLLKNEEPTTWRFLGAPSGFSFADLGNTLSLYSWVLSKKFLDSNNPEIVAEGKRAHIKARRVRYGLILGLIIMIAGLAMALVQSFA